MALARGAQCRHITFAAAAKAVVVADDEVTQAKARDEDLLDETLRLEGRKRPVEAEEDGIGQSGLREDLHLFDGRREQRRRGVGPDDAQRMRVERDEDAGTVALARALHHALQQFPVPAMHAVERTDREDGARMREWWCHTNTLFGSRRPPAARPIASSRSSCSTRTVYASGSAH